MRTGSIEHAVVVVFPGALGDLLLALPALRVLRARHAHGTLVVSQPLCALAALTGVADATVSLDGAATAALFGGGPLPPWLAGRPVVYSWLGARDDEVRRRIADAAGAAHFFTVEREPEGGHAAAAYAAAVGAPMDEAALARTGAVEPPTSTAADALVAPLRDPVLVVHAGAGARRKRWHPAGFAAVARAWRATGGDVLAVAGPAEADDPPIPDVPTARDLALPDLAAVLQRAAAYLGHDSGVSHLAGAVGAAGVVLFGATDPRRWRPLGGRLVPVRAAASGDDGIPLDALSVADVLAALGSASRHGLRPRPAGTSP